ncbi:hypothetical protein NBRC116599_38540 [Aquicoccus sp. SU-CL01552]
MDSTTRENRKRPSHRGAPVQLRKDRDKAGTAEDMNAGREAVCGVLPPVPPPFDGEGATGHSGNPEMGALATSLDFRIGVPPVLWTATWAFIARAPNAMGLGSPMVARRWNGSNMAACTDAPDQRS